MLPSLRHTTPMHPYRYCQAFTYNVCLCGIIRSLLLRACALVGGRGERRGRAEVEAKLGCHMLCCFFSKACDRLALTITDFRFLPGNGTDVELIAEQRNRHARSLTLGLGNKCRFAYQCKLSFTLTPLVMSRKLIFILWMSLLFATCRCL